MYMLTEQIIHIRFLSPIIYQSTQDSTKVQLHSLLVVMFVGRHVCVCGGRGKGGRRSWGLCLEALMVDQLLGRWPLLALDLKAAKR